MSYREHFAAAHFKGRDLAIAGARRQHLEQHDRFVEMVEIVGGEPGTRIDIDAGLARAIGHLIRRLRQLDAILIFHADPIAPGRDAVSSGAVKVQLSG